MNLKFIGSPNDRVAQLLDGRIDAANVFGLQSYIVEQQGFRTIVDTTCTNKRTAGWSGCSWSRPSKPLVQITGPRFWSEVGSIMCDDCSGAYACPRLHWTARNAKAMVPVESSLSSRLYESERTPR